MTTSENNSFGSNMISWYLLYTFITVLIIIVFIIIKYKNSNDSSDLKYFEGHSYILGIYTIFFFIYLFVFNLNLTKNKIICGTLNWKIAAFTTSISFIFVYCIGLLIILIFDGWKRSFANTFGSSFVRMMGISPIESSTAENQDLQNNSFKELTKLIYSNPDTFINEIPNGTPKSDIKKYIPDDVKIDYPILYKMLDIKEVIGTYIWVVLLGVITILVSQNLLLNENCNSTIANNTEFNNYVTNQLKK